MMRVLVLLFAAAHARVARVLDETGDAASACAGPQTYRELVDMLVGQSSGYDPLMRPTLATTPRGEAAAADRVGVQIRIDAIQKVSTSLKFMELRGEMEVWWNDPRLAFNGTADGGCFDAMIQPVPVSLSGQAPLWLPDVRLTNAVQQIVRTEERMYGIAWTSSGGVIMRTSFVTAFDCAFYLARLPFDEHTCAVEVASFVNAAHAVVIDNGGTPEYDRAGDLDTVEFSVDDLNARHDYRSRGRHAAEQPYDFLVIEVKLRRKVNYYLTTTIIPIVALLLVSFSGFFIDRKSAPARVAAAVIPVLSCLTLQNGLYSTVPRISYRSVLTDFCFSTLLFLCLNPIQYAFVSLCMIREDIAKRRLKNLRRLCLEAEENARRHRELQALRNKADKSDEEREKERELSQLLEREADQELQLAEANQSLAVVFQQEDEDEAAAAESGDAAGDGRSPAKRKHSIFGIDVSPPAALLNSSGAFYETRGHHKVSTFFNIKKERVSLKRKSSVLETLKDAHIEEDEEDFANGNEKTMADRILKHLFNTLDHSKDGQLDSGEIQYAMRYFGHYVSRAQTMELIARVDKDGDRHLDYEEYQRLMYMIVTDWEHVQPHEDFQFSMRSLSPAELTDHLFQLLYLPLYGVCVPLFFYVLYYGFNYYPKEKP